MAAAEHPACAPVSLALTFHGGGFATGNNFGTIAVTNIGRATCTLHDISVRIAPLDSAGRPIAAGPGWQALARGSDLTLSPLGGPPTWGQPAPPGDQWAAILLGGNGRDDPKSANGECAPRLEVTPYAWRVTGSSTATVRNLDAYLAAHRSRGTSPSIYACADPELSLLNVDIAQLP